MPAQPVTVDPGWGEENVGASDKTPSTILTATGYVNFSSTGTLLYLTTQNYNIANCWASLHVLAKAGANNDTIQFQVSDDNINWQNYDTAYNTVSAPVITIPWFQAWGAPTPVKAIFWRVAITLGASSTITYTAAYDFQV